MSRALHEIEALNRMVLDVELARLRARSDQLAQGRAALETMAAARRARAAEVATGDGATDLAWMTGQDALWLEWLAQERSRATATLAQAAAQHEAQRVVARRAFGRVEAVEALRRREADAARLAAARRVTMENGS